MNQHPAEQDSSYYRVQPTSSASDCRLVEDTIDEYALGVADPAVRVAIERHLVRCRRCFELTASYRETVAALALAVPMAAPPAGARTALMSRIAATPQRVAPPASVFAGDLDSLKTPTLPASSEAARPMAAQSSASNANEWWRVYAAPLATLPLLFALGLVGAWGFNNYANLNDAESVIALQDAKIAVLADQSDLDAQQFVELAFSPSVKRYNMTSDSGSPGWGTLLADPVTGQAALQVNGLPAGSYSILVQTQDGSMMPKAVFEVGGDGAASTAVDLGDAVAGFQSVHIRQNGYAETDVAVDAERSETDVLMAAFSSEIDQSSGTGVQGP